MSSSPSQGVSGHWIIYGIEGKQTERCEFSCYDTIFVISESSSIFHKNVVVTSEITGVVEGSEDHNTVNVKQLSEVVAVAKQQVVNQLLAAFNASVKELRNRMNTNHSIPKKSLQMFV